MFDDLNEKIREIRMCVDALKCKPEITMDQSDKDYICERLGYLDNASKNIIKNMEGVVDVFKMCNRTYEDDLSDVDIVDAYELLILRISLHLDWYESALEFIDRISETFDISVVVEMLNMSLKKLTDRKEMDEMSTNEE